MAHDGLGDTVRRCLVVFYANDVMVGSRDPEWLQHAMNVLVSIFRRYGLVANITKSCTIKCHPRALQAGILEEAMTLLCTVMVESYQVIL